MPRILLFLLSVTAAACLAAGNAPVDPATIPQSEKPPHPVRLLFYLTGLHGENEIAAIKQSVGMLKTVTSVKVNAGRGYALVAFDQRDLSFHEVAQAISDAGMAAGKWYDPRVVMHIPDFARPGITPKVRAILEDEKLKSLIRVDPIDEAKGVFFIHFLPLKVDPARTTWQGFNGGALTHPLHMDPPIGLSLAFKYAATDDPAIPVTPRPLVLWNGRDFSGWEFVTAPSPPVPVADVFAIKPDGVLAVVAKKLTAYLQTTADYENFAFHAEWRWTTTEKNNNSGFFMHIVGGPKDRHWPVCLQVQNKPGHTGDLIPMAGATFAELPAPPAKQMDRTGAEGENPVGEWNACDIICRGDTLECRINGRLESTATKISPHAGRIGFQLEGFLYELRNVTVTPLD